MADKKVTGWFTMNGKHIPVFEGESKKDAVKRSISNGKAHQPVSKGHTEKKWKEFEDASRKAEVMHADIDAPKYRKKEIDKAKEYDKAVEQKRKNGEITSVKMSDKTKKQLKAEKTVNQMDKDIKKNPKLEDKALTEHENKRAKKENSVASKNEDIKAKQIADAKKQADTLNGKKSNEQIFKDTDGNLGGAKGTKYTLSELQSYWNREHKNDPVMSEYSTFSAWMKDTFGSQYR